MNLKNVMIEDKSLQKIHMEISMEKEESGEIFCAFCEYNFCFIYKVEDVYEAEYRFDEYGSEFLWEREESAYIPVKMYKGIGSFVYLETFLEYGGFINIDYKIRVKD